MCAREFRASNVMRHRNQEPFRRVIRDELMAGLKNPNLERQGNSVWVAAARDDAEGYGPDWRTLVLQDRRERTHTLFAHDNT